MLFYQEIFSIQRLLFLLGRLACSGVISSRSWGAELEPILPSQGKMTVTNEKRAILHHECKNIGLLKKIDLSRWMLELCRHILIMTRFFKSLNFSWGVGLASGGQSHPCPGMGEK